MEYTYYIPVIGKVALYSSLEDAVTNCTTPSLKYIITIPKYSADIFKEVYNALYNYCMNQGECKINLDTFSQLMPEDKRNIIKQFITGHIYVQHKLYLDGTSEYVILCFSTKRAYIYKAERLLRGNNLRKEITVALTKIVNTKYYYYNIISTIPLDKESDVVINASFVDNYTVWRNRDSYSKWYMTLISNYIATGKLSIETEEIKI